MSTSDPGEEKSVEEIVRSLRYEMASVPGSSPKQQEENAKTTPIPEIAWSIYQHVIQPLLRSERDARKKAEEGEKLYRDNLDNLTADAAYFTSKIAELESKVEELSSQLEACKSLMRSTDEKKKWAEFEELSTLLKVAENSKEKLIGRIEDLEASESYRNEKLSTLLVLAKDALQYCQEIFDAPEHKLKAEVKKSWNREVRAAGSRIVKEALSAIEKVRGGEK